MIAHDDLPGAVREMAQAIGLHIVPGKTAMVYGPLDSIAILLDLLLFEDQQECSVSLKLSVMAKSIAESEFPE